MSQGHNRLRHLLPDCVHILISIPPKYSMEEVIGYLKGKSLDYAEFGMQGAEFSAPQILGYFASTVGRNEEMIRAYIKNREMADKQFDQLQWKLSSS
jgi:putative transposase